MTAAGPLSGLLQQLRQSRQRLLIWLQGEADWCRHQLAGPLAGCLQGQGALIGATPCAGLAPLPARDAHRLLGQTLDFAVFDAYAGFNPNAFGQLCGTLAGGGVLLLLTPPAAQWPQFADPEYAALCVEPYRPEQLKGHYLTHLVQILNGAETLVHWPQQGQPRLPSLPPVQRGAGVAPPCLSPDQARAVELICASIERRQPPLVLSADRGRGKSAALGIAAARLLQAGRQVAVTAVSRAAVAALLERVQALAPAQAHQLQFARPDELLQQGLSAELLLVDEAAAIPTPVLLALLERMPRIVFATTLHGYEGNGQGFALRFMRQLRQRCAEVREHHLQTPIRWADPDPLEQLSNRLLLLDAEATTPPARRAAALQVRALSAAELAADPARLRALFGLLVLAHYRTTPGDLRILLDSPNMRIYVLEADSVPVACALLAEEGPLDAALATAIWQGRRRPRGHLLPQTLIAQEGWREAAPWRYWRVVRIAVHPAARQQGLGSRLLAAIEQAARESGQDALGASFAASDELLAFWRHNGYQPLRLGDQRDPVAGSHALLVLKPLSAPVQRWLPQAAAWFRRSVLQRVAGLLHDLEAERLAALLHAPAVHWQPDADLSARLQGFAEQQRSLESSLLPLTELVQASIGRWSDWGVAVADQHLLCERILRQRGPEAVATPVGKRAQLDRLRQLCQWLLVRLAAESPSALRSTRHSPAAAGRTPADEM